MIADAMLQQILTRPDDYDVIATMNLNGDYLSDALAAQVGGIGIAPGANIGDEVALFEATHGTAPKYTAQDKVNPGSLILSAEMMLRHLGWREAADLVVQGMEGAISAATVTYDFERLMTGATLLKCSRIRRRHHRQDVARALSRGARGGLPPRMEEPSAGEREGLAPRMKEPQRGRSHERNPQRGERRGAAPSHERSQASSVRRRESVVAVRDHRPSARSPRACPWALP